MRRLIILAACVAFPAMAWCQPAPSLPPHVNDRVVRLKPQGEHSFRAEGGFWDGGRDGEPVAFEIGNDGRWRGSRWARTTRSRSANVDG
jgi:hypothetical protein